MALIIDGIMTGKLPWGAGAARASSSRSSWNWPASRRCRSRSACTCRCPLDADLRRRPRPRGSSTGSSRRRAEESDSSPGVLLASGYIAGGAIAGILIAVLDLFPERPEASSTSPSACPPRWNESAVALARSPSASTVLILAWSAPATCSAAASVADAVEAEASTAREDRPVESRHSSSQPDRAIRPEEIVP